MTARDETPITDAAAFPILSRLQSGTEDVIEAIIARSLESRLARVEAAARELLALRDKYPSWSNPWVIPWEALRTALSEQETPR